MKASALALLCLLLGMNDAFAENLRDIRGRDVPLGKGRPALVFYSNRETRDVLRNTAFDFAYTVKDAKPIVVVRIDLSEVPHFVQPLIRGQISDSYRKSVEHVRNIYRAHGETPPENVEEHVFFVVDSDGEGRKSVGLKGSFRQALVQVVDAEGKVLTTQPFPEKAESVREAVAKTR